MKKEMILMIGLPFAGKSTYVKNLISRAPYQVIEGSAILRGLQLEGIDASNENMQPVYKVQKVMAKAFMSRDMPIIIDERNLTLESIFLWRQLAETTSYKTSAIIIDTPVEVCLERAKEKNKNTLMFEYIKTCSRQLDELRTMLGFKYQNILSSYRVINLEE